MSNGRANNSNVYSNASNCFSSRFNGFLTIYKRFEPLNVKALVYVFPWKVTCKRKIHKLLLTVLDIEDDYVDAHSLILNFKNTGIELS